LSLSTRGPLGRSFGQQVRQPATVASRLRLLRSPASGSSNDADLSMRIMLTVVN
jgi:hypothetical protein